MSHVTLLLRPSWEHSVGPGYTAAHEHLCDLVPCPHSLTSPRPLPLCSATAAGLPGVTGSSLLPCPMSPQVPSGALPQSLSVPTWFLPSITS